MKRKLLILCLTVIGALCCAFGFSACFGGNNGGNGGGGSSTENGGGSSGSSTCAHSWEWDFNDAFERHYEWCRKCGSRRNSGSCDLSSGACVCGNTIFEFANGGDYFTGIKDGYHLSEITVPAQYKGVNVTVIDSGAFYDRPEITKITLPDTIKEIYDSAFARCTNLKSLTIPGSVEYIGSCAFAGSGLTDIVIPNSVTYMGSALFENCENIVSIKMPFFSEWGFSGCFGTSYISGHEEFMPASLKSVEITGNTMTEIPDDAFEMCSGLTEIIIPDGVTKIGHSAFYGCASLKEFTIPETVENIGIFAFADCSSLESIVIPDSVVTFGREPGLTGAVFTNCTSLKDIVIGKGVTEIGGKFVNCTAVVNLTLPFGYGMFAETLKTVTVTEGVTSINNSAFSGYENLTEINLPESLTTVGNRAFRNCSSITSLTFGKNVQSIGYSAFSGCTSLENLSIPDGINEIGTDAFGDCGKLVYNTYENNKYLGNAENPHVALIEAVSSTIHGDTKLIYHSAFKGSAIESVTIPDGVAGIGRRLFASCSSLTSVNVGIGNEVYYSDGNCIIEKATNKLVAGCKSSVIPNGVASIADYAFYEQSGLTSLKIPASVKAIGSYAFAYSGLESVSMAGVKTVGEYAFYSCNGLTDVIITGGLTEIGERAFAECRHLETVYLPKSLTEISGYAFQSAYGITINYAGTSAQWENVTKGNYWYPSQSVTVNYGIVPEPSET